MLSQIWHVCPQEVSILKSLNYDRNITQFYGACIRPGQDLMLVTEVCARAMVHRHREPLFCLLVKTVSMLSKRSKLHLVGACSVQDSALLQPLRLHARDPR